MIRENAPRLIPPDCAHIEWQQAQCHRCNPQLEETVSIRLDVAIYNGVLEERRAYCSVNGCADDALAVIVIDFDDIEFLKEHKVVSYEPFDVALHFGL